MNLRTMDKEEVGIRN